MRSSAEEPEVIDARTEGRFVLEEDGALAELVYDVEGSNLLLIHTGVPAPVRRRGLGGRLVRAAVDRAVADGLTVVPLCSFARRWLRDHPDVADEVDIDWSSSPSDRR